MTWKTRLSTLGVGAFLFASTAWAGKGRAADPVSCPRMVGDFFVSFKNPHRIEDTRGYYFKFHFPEGSPSFSYKTNWSDDLEHQIDSEKLRSVVTVKATSKQGSPHVRSFACDKEAARCLSQIDGFVWELRSAARALTARPNESWKMRDALECAIERSFEFVHRVRLHAEKSGANGVSATSRGTL